MGHPSLFRYAERLLLGLVYRHLAEILEKFSQLQSSLACTHTGSLVIFLNLGTRVGRESLVLNCDLIYQIFHIRYLFKGLIFLQIYKNFQQPNNFRKKNAARTCMRAQQSYLLAHIHVRIRHKAHRPAAAVCGGYRTPHLHTTILVSLCRKNTPAWIGSK